MTGRPLASRDAPAKLNVFLRVLGAREDGYHELESLVLPLALADRVTATDAAELDVVVEPRRAVRGTGRGRHEPGADRGARAWRRCAAGRCAVPRSRS